MRNSLTIIFTIIITMVQFFNGYLDQNTNEKYREYSLQYDEFRLLQSDLLIIAGNHTSQVAGWIACLNIKDSAKCKTLEKLADFEFSKYSASSKMLADFVAQYDKVEEEYFKALDYEKSILPFTNKLFAIFSFSIVLINVIPFAKRSKNQ